MKTKLAILCLLSAGLSPLGIAQGTAFTYQGRLDDGAAPANGLYDLTYTLFTVSSGAGQVGSTLLGNATSVSNGLFTVTLDFGANFPGADRWLEIAVRTNGGGAFTTLIPRQPLTATPYAVTAGTVTGAITEAQLPSNTAKLNVANTASQATGVAVITSGFITSANVTFGGSGYTTPPTVTVNAGLGSGAIITAGISGGAVTVLTVQNAGSGYTSGATLTIAPPPSNGYQVFTSTNYFTTASFLTNANNSFAGNGSGLTGLWRLGGNAGTTPGAQFIGTTDNQPLEFKVNGVRGLRIEPAAGRPNVIGGSSNTVAAGVEAATIAGGLLNAIGTNSSRSTIGGGSVNNIAANSLGTTISGGDVNDIGTNSAYGTISGGWDNNVSFGTFAATISGGWWNHIGSDSDSSAIGGGYDNNIADFSNYGTIAGGNVNHIGANSHFSVIGGGSDNRVLSNSVYAIIPGGNNNSATNNAFAAGTRAKANHTGSFIWADSTDIDHASTGNNQFLIRAAGGVGINTNNPTAALHVGGIPGTDGIRFPNGTLQTTAPVPVFASGIGLNPTTTNQFLAQPVTVTVNSTNQRILVTSHKALGSVAVGGATGLNLYIGYRSAGSGSSPTTVGGGIFANRVTQNTQIPMGLSAMITGLAPGNYEVGLMGSSVDAGNWNSNEYSYTTATVY